MGETGSSLGPSDSSSHQTALQVSPPEDGLVITTCHGVQAVLSDKRFEVPEPSAPYGPVGSVSWLRSAVVRFVNGETHDRRLAIVLEELQGLEPDDLGFAAGERTRVMLDSFETDGGPEMIASLAHRIPMEVIASALRFTDVTAAATAP